MSGLILKNVKKSFGKVKVIHGIDLEVEEGEFIVIVGPSGCGKSTLLRMIAGLENVTYGDILIDNLKVNDKEPMDRNIAMVFQNYALYPHMNVARNLHLGISGKMSREEKDELVEQILNDVDLTGFQLRNVDELSGGEAQRVALARTLLTKPRALLMDEPFSALDTELRESLAEKTRKLLSQLDIPIIHVTHDVDIRLGQLLAEF